MKQSRTKLANLAQADRSELTLSYSLLLFNFGNLAMRNRSSGCIAAAALLVVVALIGCGGSSTEVQGKVTLDGQPAEGVDVKIFADGSEIAEFSGLSGPDGTFKIAMAPGKKVKPGKYKVTAVKYVGKGDSKLSGQPGIDILQLKAMGLAQNTLPAIYESPQQTPVTVDLTEQTASIDVPLKSN